MINTALMPFDVLIPQMGEGIREVTILGLMKQPGDSVRRDEVIYEMETDKANLEIESPHDGILDSWLVRPGDTVNVGSPVARMISSVNGNGNGTNGSGSLKPISNGHTAATVADAAPILHLSKAPGDLRIPPRTVAYCRSLGISDAQMRTIPAAKRTLDIPDIDRYLAGSNEASISETTHIAHIDRLLSAKQISLNQHFERSAQTVVTASIKMHLNWDVLEAKTLELRHKYAIPALTEFQTLSYCVARAVISHPKFRSTLVPGNIRREFAHVNLGFAVALPDDDLVTAVIREADTLDLPQFARAVMRQLRQARRGRDQAASDTQITISYLASHGVVNAIPVLVPPAAATLFVGAPYQFVDGKIGNLVLAFDHRSINGVGAANFLQEVTRLVAAVE